MSCAEPTRRHAGGGKIVVGVEPPVQPDVEPLFTVSAHQHDPKTMPSESSDNYTVNCLRESDQQPASAKVAALGIAITIFTGSRTQKCWIGSDVDSVSFAATRGGRIDFPLHRIEVDDVTLTDENPPRPSVDSAVVVV